MPESLPSRRNGHAPALQRRFNDTRRCQRATTAGVVYSAPVVRCQVLTRVGEALADLLLTRSGRDRTIREVHCRLRKFRSVLLARPQVSFELARPRSASPLLVAR